MASSHKLLLVWILGGLFLLAGVWIVQNLEINVGVSGTSYLFALLTALLFFLLAGFCWISVAVGTRHRFM